MSENRPIDFAIIMTSGPQTPMRLASPFYMAATAGAEDMNVVVFFTGQGTELLKKGVAENTYAKEGGKSIADFMKMALDNDVKFMACGMSMDLHNMTQDDLAYDVPTVGVAESLPHLASANKLVSF